MTRPVRTPTTVDAARRRPPRIRLRTTTSVSGPGSSTIRTEAAAKPSSAASTSRRYAARLLGRSQYLLFLLRCRTDAGARLIATGCALLAHPLERVARGV